MSEIEKFIRERKIRNPKAWLRFEEKYRDYAIGMLLADHRLKAGLTLSAMARRINMQKAALSRLENHGEDVRLSTITRYVEATGLPLELRIVPSAQRKPGKRRMAAIVGLVTTGGQHSF